MLFYSCARFHLAEFPDNRFCFLTGFFYGTSSLLFGFLIQHALFSLKCIPLRLQIFMQSFAFLKNVISLFICFFCLHFRILLCCINLLEFFCIYNYMSFSLYFVISLYSYVMMRYVVVII